MFRFMGPIQTLMASIEPRISDVAANQDSHNNNIYHHHHHHHHSYNSNLILTYSQYTNLAIFMILFMLCAIEVIFVKIVTAINLTDESSGLSPVYDAAENMNDDIRNNNNYFQIDRELQRQLLMQQQQPPPPHQTNDASNISTETVDINNNSIHSYN